MNEEKFKEIGKRIKLLREKNGESQEKLAKAISLSQNSISKIEKGITQLTLEHLCDIAEHFNVSHDYICTGRDDNSILTLLEKYISLEYRNIECGNKILACPILNINKVLYDYLVKTANAKHEKYLPDVVRDLWIENEIQEFYKQNKENNFMNSESVVPLPLEFISPDDAKSDWNQADLLRELNRHILEVSSLKDDD